MKILSFIPLLVWMLGFLAISEWSEHLRVIDGRGEEEGESEAAAKIFAAGFLLWFFLGAYYAL